MSFTSSSLGHTSASYILAIVVSTILLILVIAVLLYFTRPILLTELSPNTGPLDKSTPIGTISDTRNGFFTPSGATITVNLYIETVSKTTNVEKIGRPILQLGSTVGLVLLPGNTQGPGTTVLMVKTQSPKDEYETILLEQFPIQKWVHLAIVREGRRFTVYYNGKIVGSSRTKYFPVINSSQCVVGSKELIGTFSHVKIAPVPLREFEIHQELRSTANTRYVPNSPFIDFPSFNLGCPNGIFCFSTSSGPSADPLKLWKSPYA